jgi:hypothetical protein
LPPIPPPGGIVPVPSGEGEERMVAEVMMEECLANYEVLSTHDIQDEGSGRLQGGDCGFRV